MTEPPVVVELTREEAAQKAGALEGAASSASMGYPNTPEGYERLCEFLLETASWLQVALSSTAEAEVVWACATCGYQNSGSVCTKCHTVPAEAEGK